jgi:hypothetical protein
MQLAKALKWLAVSGIGVATSVFLTVAIVQFAAPEAEATPAMAKGKPCSTCHSSASPSKSDIKRKKKRKRSEIWPDERDVIAIAHAYLR